MPFDRDFFRRLDDALARLVLEQDLHRLGVDNAIARWLTDGRDTTMQDYGISSVTWSDC